MDRPRRRSEAETAAAAPGERSLLSVLACAAALRDQRDGLRIVPGPKVFPTSLPIEDIAAGTLGAVGLGVAALWKARGGGSQSCTLTTRAAGLAMNSSAFLRVDGRDIGDKDRINGYYRARDGWVFLHGNFPHLRDGLFAMLGASDRGSLVDAVARRGAGDIEAEAAERGLCAVAVRTRDEWRSHPQAAAIDRLPLIEIRRVGDAPAEPLPRGDRPLAGIRVLDLTRVIAGPMAGRALAEHGATVMLVSGPHLPFIPNLVIDTGFGKLSSLVDLRTEQGTGTLQRLVREADVFVSAYRPGSLGARGFAPDALAALRPGLVSVSISAFSRAGPWSARRGYDSLVQAAAGLSMLDANGTPRLQPCQPLDYLTGYLAALGAMIALLRRAEEGGSWHVELSLARTAHWLLEMADSIGPDADLPGARPGVAEVGDLMAETSSVFGLLHHLAPAIVLSESPGYFWRPPVTVGFDAPVWP